MIDLKKIFDKQTNNLHYTENDRVLIIDGTNSYLRVCSSIAHINNNGVNVGAIVGFLRSIGSNIREFNASRCIIVFDGKGGSIRRKKIFPEYKANRKANSFKPKRAEGFEMSELEERENMKWQLHRILLYLDSLPIQILTGDGVEADDLIAYICKQYYTDNEFSTIRIVSTDKDFLQLVSDKIEVWNPVKKTLFTPNVIEATFGINYNNFLLFRTIEGDNSDNINGINNIGLKTIIKNFPDIVNNAIDYEYIYDRCLFELKSKKPKKIFFNILENKSIIDRNYILMQLSEVDIPNSVKLLVSSKLKSKINPIDRYKIRQLILEDSINSAFKNFDNWIYQFNKLNVWATH